MQSLFTKVMSFSRKQVGFSKVWFPCYLLIDYEEPKTHRPGKTESKLSYFNLKEPLEIEIEIEVE